MALAVGSRKIENIKQDGNVIGNRARVKIVKNKRFFVKKLQGDYRS